MGGVPEVLPERFIYFSAPDASAIESALSAAVEDVVAGRRPSAAECHRFVRGAYNWAEVADRTERVYASAVLEKCRRGGPPPLARRVRNLWERGHLAGPLMAALYLFCHYWIMFLDWISPVTKLETR